MTIRIAALEDQAWPLRQAFTIARGSRTEARLLYLQLEREGIEGHAECVPYARYGETMESVTEQIRGAVLAHGDSLDMRMDIQELPAGAARNALDCALWDLEAKTVGRRVWELLEIPAPAPSVTVETISIDTVAAMRNAAEAASHRPVLKVKLDGDLVVERIQAVRAGAPSARIVVDANEAWTPDLLREVMIPLRNLGVVMIEQPLPAGEDEALRGFDSPIPLGADESFHTTADVDRCSALYSVLNIKLDKAGGLTEALAMLQAAKAAGTQIMVGCMLATSLGMAPATLLTNAAAFVDLDGPLWMSQDRIPPLPIENSEVGLPPRELWG